MDDRAQAVGLFRYSLVRELASERLSNRERGVLARSMAAREHIGPDGLWVRVSRTSLDRWTRAYRLGGFEALVPAPRRVETKTPAHLLDMACALRREQPARTAAQIYRIIVEAEGWSPSARTLQRHLAAAGLPWRGASPARATGRFEAERRNELWTGDALHGPPVEGRKTFLFAFIDDHSRLLAGYRWATREDVLNASRALRLGIAARGLPEATYVDNGSPFVSGQLLRACALLGIRLIHSRPGRPEGRGKIERFFRTVREQFLREVAAPSARERGGAEPIVHRVGGIGLSPRYAFGDRAAATGALPRRRACADAADGGGVARGVSVVGEADGVEDRHVRDARQRLRGRRRARPPAG